MNPLDHLPKNQELLVQRLKTRGPQSIKILAAELALTTMGVRQHLTQLQEQGYVKHAQISRQTRGRPVVLWKLTGKGHELFGDKHARLAVRLLTEIENTYGIQQLNALIESEGEATLARYRERIPSPKNDLKAALEALRDLRTEEGFMAELRFTPSGWLLTENHCPIVSAAKSCRAFCKQELALFEAVLSPHARVERSDHLLSGARRCAYRIQPN